MLLSLLIVVLKIIAVLAALILIILALVLFIPVRYKASASKKGAFTADVEASWLLRIFVFYYKKTTKRTFIKFSVFGKLIGRRKKPKPEKDIIKEEKKKKEINAESERNKKGKKQETAEELGSKDGEDGEKENRLSTVVAMYKHPDRNELIRLTLRLCKDLLNGLRPKLFRIKAVIGTGDPATTGYALGLFESVKPFLGADINIKGNFEKAEADGEMEIAGRLYIYRLLFPLCRFALAKPVWKLIKKYFFKKDDDNEYKLEQQPKRAI